jgi:ABC-type sugar transport system ATPase subunit
LRSAEAVAVLGPSGGGKTTLLYTVAGFVPCSRGTIRIAGRLVAQAGPGLPPEERNVGVVFQNYALWPHLTALDNVAYPLRRDGVRRVEARRRAAVLLERMGVDHVARRRPAELSGGEQQRVGVARALARKRTLYLFDEPTGAPRRRAARGVAGGARRPNARRSAPRLYATHDVAEAFACRPGRSVSATVRSCRSRRRMEIYEQPVDLWAARLTDPRRCSRSGVAAVGPSQVDVTVGGAAMGSRWHGGAARSGGLARLLVRPEWAGSADRCPAVCWRCATAAPTPTTGSRRRSARWRCASAALLGRAVGDPVGWGLDRGWLLAAGEVASLLGAPDMATRGSVPDRSAPAARW